MLVRVDPAQVRPRRPGPCAPGLHRPRRGRGVRPSQDARIGRIESHGNAFSPGLWRARPREARSADADVRLAVLLVPDTGLGQVFGALMTIGLDRSVLSMTMDAAARGSHSRK